MKLNRIVVFVVTIFTLLGCEKNYGNLKDYPQLVGDYDWEYSIIDGTTTITKEQSDKHFGFRIKKNGTVILYENGEEIARTDYCSVNEWNSGVLHVSAYTNEINFSFNMDDTECYSTVFPAVAVYNKFDKK